MIFKSNHIRISAILLAAKCGAALLLALPVCAQTPPPAATTQIPAVAPQVNPTAPSAQNITDYCVRDAAARNSFNDFVRAYESGQVNQIRGRLDPAMIGYQRFIDGVTSDVTRLKQMRILLSDVQMQCGPDVAVFNANWEKRFLDVATFQPGLHTGRISVLMHRDASGWRLVSMAGDNLFASSMGVAGRIVLAPTVSINGVGVTPTPLSVTLEVIDPDLAGTRTLTVQVITTNGDSENVVLTEVTPGRFTRTTLNVSTAAASPNNGTVELASGANLIVRYIDQQPGGNRPASLISASARAVGTAAAATATAITSPPSLVFSPNPVISSPTSCTGATSTATVTGITAPATITIAGAGTYSINGGTFTAAAGTVTNGQTITVRRTSFTPFSVTLTITVGTTVANVVITC